MTRPETRFVDRAALWNALARCFGQPMPVQGGTVTLSETAHAPSQTVVHYSLGTNIGPDLHLFLPDFPFEAITGTALSLRDVQGLPEVLREGLLLGAAEVLSSALPEALAQQLSGIELGKGPVPQCETWLDAPVTLSGGAVIPAALGGTRDGFAALMEALFPEGARTMPVYPSVLAAHVPVHLVLCAGALTLPLATLRTLEPGDVVLPQLDAALRVAHVAGRRMIFEQTADDTGAAQWSVKEVSMATDDSAAEHGEQTPHAGQEGVGATVQPAGFDDIPIRLDVALQSQTVSLEALQAMGPGQILPFDMHAMAPGLAVQLLANGVVIGSGHLIEIDGQYAVRIAQMPGQETAAP